MIRVAIVDDELVILNSLKQYLKEYEKEMDVKFKVTVYLDAIDIVTNYRTIYDIIFMDIKMAKMDGLTAAEKIREVDKNVIIIFVTNLAGFAIKGYKVDALSYVVKPILYVDFVQQLNMAVRRLLYSRNSFILVSVNNEIRRLDVSRIAYMESVEHKVVIHMESEDVTVYSSLKKIENQVKDYHFVRCNSGYLVSLSHVERLDKDIVYVNGTQLVISRSKKKLFMNALAEFIGGEYK